MRHNLIILVNSRKMRSRCIAGIDPETGEWVRPVYGAGDQGVPRNIRQVGGAGPHLLDIISIPLATYGPHRDIQPENRSILKGAWGMVGRATAQRVARYRQKLGLVLHNADRRIHVDALRGLSEGQRKSLCLIRAHVAFSTEGTYRGKRVKARFMHGGHECIIPVTDYEFDRRFPPHSNDEARCLLTISLGLPFDRDNCCYKFVAGVIELSDTSPVC